MKIYHFYHLYLDGEWIHAAKEHFASLERSLLIDNLEKIFVNVVGTSTRLTHLENWLSTFMDKYPNKIIVTHWGEGHEQLTINKIIDFLNKNRSEEFYILYAHTKGASKVLDGYAQYAISWRREMTFHNIIKWQVPVWHLDNGCDTVGAFGCYGFRGMNVFWAGNFWWAKSEYLRQLPEPDESSPNEAEYWIGLGNIKKYFDLHPGRPIFQNFPNSWTIKSPYGEF